jgi:hypothetical protein
LRIRKTLAFVGFALLYLAAFNGILPFNLGTCTQGGADGLWGAVLSLMLYLFGVVCLLIARPSRPTYIAAFPPLVLLAWQLKFTIELTYGYLVQGKSACAIMHDLPYEFDGHEAYFIDLWLTMCLVPLIGLSLAFWRARPSRSQA